jgi:general secretion pathway protein K
MIGGPIQRGSRRASAREPRRGAVLIVALWVVIILSLMVSTLAFEMHVEAKVTSYYRSRMKAQYLTLAGVEWAKMLLVKSRANDPFLEENYPELYVPAEILRRGNAVTGLTRELGDGTFTIDLVPEQGRRNVNRLEVEDWHILLESNYVPEDRWDELVDAFMDWVDRDEEHRLSGAESDDSYYEERGYKVKNAPVDMIDELVLIKGFTPAMVYGGPSEDPELPPYPGLAQWLTTVGDGKINVNAAAPDVLLSLPGMDEFAVEAILEGRLGIDGEPDTEDDGFESVDQVIQLTGLDPSLAGLFTTRDQAYIRLKVVGQVGEVRSGIWAIYRLGGNLMSPHFWREEQLP